MAAISISRSSPGRCITRRRCGRVRLRPAHASSSLSSSSSSTSVSTGACEEEQQQDGSATASEEEDEAPLLVRAALGQHVSRTPVWLFRQAGRHLPEYTEYKRTRGKNFLELLRDPDDVAEVTLQPLRRYPLDAAVLFSDILVVPQALGIDVEMPGGRGITVPRPLRTVADVSALLSAHETLDAREDVVLSRLAHVLEGAERAAAGLRAGGLASAGVVPLIGFSAAPWTLFYYMVGGSSTRATDSGTRWLREEPALSERLLSMLTNVVVEYLVAQVDSGASVLQIFEAMGEHIGQEDFERFATPCLVEIAEQVRSRRPNVPLMVFTRDAMHAIDDMQRARYDVITLDLSVRSSDVRQRLERNYASSSSSDIRVPSLQGNFDPSYLLPSAPGWETEIESAVRFMLEGSGTQQLIFNIGAGLTGREETEKVLHLVNCVHDISAAMINESSERSSSSV